MNKEQAFEDWKRRAEQNDLLATAVTYGAVLKRTGREHVGPCPACGGVDRFSVNPSKNAWNCRGHSGGHGAIGMVMHIAGLSFSETCEALTGEPNPTTNRPARPLSAEEQAARNRQRIDAERASEARRAQEVAYQEDTTRAALAIWEASAPLADTLAEKYLNSRGIPTLDPWPDVIRFHPGLPYPGKSGRYPAMICRVDGLDGELTAIWRIFLRADARKLDVANPKLGLGPAGGGAVRLGGIGRKIAAAEGIESAFGYWLLTGQKYPTWAALSTSGLVGLELPLGVEHLVVAPDGDRPLRKKGNEYEPAVPAGRKAAQALRTRLLQEGIFVTIAAEPPAGKDMLDMWNASQAEVA